MSNVPNDMHDVQNRLLEGDAWRQKADVTFAEHAGILRGIVERLDGIARDYRESLTNRRSATQNIITWSVGAAVAIGSLAIWVISTQVNQQVGPLAARMGAMEARTAAIEATDDRIQDTANAIRAKRDDELRSDDNRIDRLEYFNQLMEQGRLRLPAQP